MLVYIGFLLTVVNRFQAFFHAFYHLPETKLLEVSLRFTLGR